jgi:CHAD domain-containing protein
MSKPTEVPGLGPRTRVSVAGPLLVRARLADLRRHEGALLEDGEPDPDAVHDMRVAARRLRAALALFGDADLLALERQVEALQDALGDLRDLQVQRTWLLGARATSARALADAVEEERPRLEKRLRAALRGWTGAIAPALERAAAGAAGKGKLGGKRLAKEVRRNLRRLERRLAAAEADPAPRAAHRLRVAAKRLRDVAELARPGRPDAAGRLLDALVPLQERLGALHDTDVRIERMAELVASGPPRARASARALLEGARRDRTRQEDALRAELARWRAEGVIPSRAAGFAKARRRGRVPARAADAGTGRGDARTDDAAVPPGAA